MLRGQLHYCLATCLAFKRDLRPKSNSCFYSVISMILWKKSLVQSCVVFWSVLMKSWIYKVLNPEWVTSYPRICKTFLLILWKNNFSHSLMVVSTISHELMKLRNIKWLSCLDIRGVIYAMNLHNILTVAYVWTFGSCGWWCFAFW